MFYFLFTPVLALKIRFAESRAQIFCAEISSGEEIFYASINSIYDVPVTERWRVQADGVLQIVDVVSSAAVMEYYRLDDYVSAGGGEYRAMPRELKYSEVKLRVDAQGQEKLIVHGNEIALSALVPEATVVIIAVERLPRALACL
jgi:hypothetical protein